MRTAPSCHLRAAPAACVLIETCYSAACLRKHRSRTHYSIILLCGGAWHGTAVNVTEGTGHASQHIQEKTAAEIAAEPLWYEGQVDEVDGRVFKVAPPAQLNGYQLSLVG